MTEEELIFAMARSMVRSSQGEIEKPESEWTNSDLVTEGFYADAKACLETIRANGYIVREKKPQPKEDVVALAEAIANTFPSYRRISAADAAKEILGQLADMKFKLTRIIGLSSN